MATTQAKCNTFSENILNIFGRRNYKVRMNDGSVYFSRLNPRQGDVNYKLQETTHALYILICVSHPPRSLRSRAPFKGGKLAFSVTVKC